MLRTIRSNLMPTTDKAAASWIAAIGDPTRLGIIRVLATGDKNVTDIATAVREELPNVSHHLSVLKAAGLATETRMGRFRVYSLVGAEAKGAAVELTHESGVKVSIPLV
jgi:ArsR family transcriptional regulator